MSPRSAASIAVEIARVARILAVVERDRRTRGTADAVARARSRGTRESARSDEQRTVLRRAIGIVDARLGEPNCFRRALLEMSLDALSASEPLILELVASSAANSGHARLASWPADGRRFDATITL